jgi:hypothetical protein
VDTGRLAAIQRAELEQILKRALPEDHEHIGTFFERIAHALSETLISQGFGLVFDNRTLPPYHGKRHPDHISFGKNSTLVDVFQEDWRDTHFMYHVQVQGRIIASIDETDGRSNEERVNHAISKLKAALSPKG